MPELSRYVKWLVAAIVLLVLAFMTSIVIRQWEVLVTFSWRISAKYLVLTVVFHSLALWVTFFVWHLMITRFGGFNDLRMNFRFYYVSTLAKRIPTAIWYIGGRLMMYRQVGVLASEVLNCILLENIVIGIAGVFTFLALLPFYSRLPRLGILPLTLVGFVGVAGLLIRPRVFVDIINWILKRFDKQELDTAPTRKDVVLWGGLYILPWLLAGVALYCATRAFSESIELGIANAIGISTLSMLVSLLSIVLPGGLGLKELTSSALLAHWMPFSTAIVVSLAYRLIQTVNEVIWALTAMAFSAPPRSGVR